MKVRNSLEKMSMGLRRRRTRRNRAMKSLPLFEKKKQTNPPHRAMSISKPKKIHSLRVVPADRPALKAHTQVPRWARGTG